MSALRRFARLAPPYRRFVLTGAILLAGFCVQPSAQAQEESNEYQLKAAFLYNLARMIEWPEAIEAQTSEPFQICFWGQDVFGDTLDSIAGKNVRDRPLHLNRQPNEADLTRCQAVFISASEGPRLEKVLTFLQDSPVLSVCEVEGFTERGCIVNLIKDGQRLKIEINLPASERAQLKISSRLLTLARIVQ